MKTTLAKAETTTHDWKIVDATDQILGRLAVQIANALRGRNKPTYTPHVDTGDFVIVTNADKIKLTGSKEEQKKAEDASLLTARYLWNFLSGMTTKHKLKSIAA